MANIYLAGELIPAANLPDFKAVINRGETKFKVTVTARAMFSDAQLAACTLGSIVAASVDGVSYTGVVTGIGFRESYSICQIDEAVVGN